MTDEEIERFWEYVRHAQLEFRDWRRGQTFMNALRIVAPEFYNDIVGTKYDIFYRDTSQDIYRFREYFGI